MKRLMPLILAICIVLSQFTATLSAEARYTAKNTAISMQILGKSFSSANGAVLKDGVVYLPLRTVGEALSYKVAWNSSTKIMQLTATSGAKIKVTVSSKNAYIGTKKVVMDKAALLINSKAYVSISFIQGNFNYDTSYDKTKKIVYIKNKSAAAGRNLIFDGKKIAGKENVLLYKNKLYIPLRTFGETADFSVAWNPKNKVMELKKGTLVSRVTLGSLYSTLNGKGITIEAAPIMYNNKVYAHLSFYQKNLKYEVSYDKAAVYIKTKITGTKPVVPTNTPAEIIRVEDIEYDESGGFPQLSIVADKPIDYESFTLTEPDRMVIDIKNAIVATDFETKEIGKGGVLRARIGQFSVNPKIVRVVVDLTDQQKSKLVQSDDKKSLAIIYANFILPVAYEKVSGKDVLVLQGSTDLDTSVIKLENPDRLIIDIKRSVLEQDSETIDAMSDYIKSIKTGQFDVGTVRITVEMQPNIYFDVKNDGNTTNISFSNMPFSFMEYEKYYNSVYVDLSPGKYIDYDAVALDNKTIKVYILEDLKVELKKYDINDNVIEYAEVSKEQINNKVYTAIVFKMKDKVTYQLLSPANTDVVKLKFQYTAITADQLTVVIDPGHGGKDPGAVSAEGIFEKQINLEVASKLDTILKGLGFKTILTRTDDSYVDLATRTGLANDGYADFYMCIHFNAFNSNVRGIETLYYPNTITDEYPIENKKVAAIFHQELTQALNRSSRGITPRPNLYVLNKTKMPAILAELGFITNKEEMALIKTDEYKEKAAKALAVSIVKYYKDIQGIDLGINTDNIYSVTAGQ